MGMLISIICSAPLKPVWRGERTIHTYVPWGSTALLFAPTMTSLCGRAAGVGHQFCSDLCLIGEKQGGLVEVALSCGIVIAGLIAPLANDGCRYKDAAFADPKQGCAFVLSSSFFLFFAMVFTSFIELDSSMY
jgi:hypothetical protein